ncbi:MAG: phosphatase PAP2 family protein [Gemmatimonadota bacterium]|nr:phosphatase PAP2 family protein [Gemmatimonadota bacterium]
MDLGRRPPSAAPPVIREHGPLLVIIAIYTGSALIADLLGIVPGLTANVLFLSSYLFYGFIALYSVAALAVVCRLSVKDERGRWIAGRAGWGAGWARLRTRFLTRQRLGGFVIASVAVPVLMNTFGSWKAALPRIHAFRFDETLTRLDAELHFGRLPWQWLQSVLGHPPVTVAIDALYYCWLVLLTGVVVWQAWSERRELRARFFISFALIWCLLGSVAAIAFSSAGPCYYALVTGNASPYADLMAYLNLVDRTHPLTALYVQGALWNDYAHATATPFTGISAMPSLHVAMPVLFALLGGQVHRILGAAFSAFAAVVLLGSVHLGWHYAIDGYLSIAGVVAIWWLSARIVRRYCGFPGAM